jgi:hypothetical protein
MWPSHYWRLWSDAIVSRVHRRVFENVKQLADVKRPLCRSTMNTMKLLQILGAVGAFVLLVSHRARAGGPRGPWPGGEIYGRVHFPISCSPAVQAEFDRAVAMLHSFFYPET